jgi:hypothetical protein
MAVWLAARTLQDFGNATADWLAGRIGHMPTRSRYTHPNEESMGLMPFLNPLNRAGILVSTFSQPACLPGVMPYGGVVDVQRAAVSGFMPKTYTDVLHRLVVSCAGVELLDHPPGAPHQRSYVVVSRWKGKDGTFTGHVESPEDIERNYGGVGSYDDIPGLHSDVIRELQACHQVDLYDVEWGRNDKLWPLMQRLFEATSE